MTENGSFPYDLLPGSPILRTLTLEQQIEWFEESLQRRIFRPAKLMLDTGDENVDSAVLAILIAVPEMLAQLQDPNEKSSTKRYRKGIEYIFPQRAHNVFDDEKLIRELIYGTLRCGLAHFALASESIFLSREDENLSSIVISYVDIGIKPGWTYSPPSPLLTINVPEWYAQTEKRVGDYISDLRNPTNDDLRSKFSERITRGDAPRKDAPTGCVCAPKCICMHCASKKFPATHL